MSDRTRVRVAWAVVVAALVAGFGAGTTAAVAASGAQPTLVNAVPDSPSVTPAVDDGVVYSITQVGSWTVVGGSFTTVTPVDPSSAAELHGYVFAYDHSTGRIDENFAPQLNGTVNAVSPGPDAGTVYLGGAFTTVNGTSSRGATLLDLDTGKVAKGFTSPVSNGLVWDLQLASGRLWLVGSFTKLRGVAHQGVGTVDPRTGAVDAYVGVQLTGHHNYDGTGAQGPQGGRALAVSPDGAHAVVVGNFKMADGVTHDQIVQFDLGRSAATIAPWNTAAFSSPCARTSFDTYVEDVAYAPDSSAFDVATSGAQTMSTNTDGTRSLCDSVSRWSTGATGSNVRPSWVDYSGNDSFWVIADTGTAIYAGGHARWMNNPDASDQAGPGSVPRPGIVALDPTNGLPYSWNPGRNPRGKGAYALYASSDGLYVGSDTEYFGPKPPRYHLPRLALFPLTGGQAPASEFTTALPSNVYQAGGTPPGDPANADALVRRPMSGTAIGSPAPVTGSNVAWGASRGAFTVGNQLFWSAPDPNDNNAYALYRAGFDGSVGSPQVVDPYDDPAWSGVKTGSGQTYQGVRPSYYAEMPSVTGQFFAHGKIFYSLAGRKPLYWRYFEPDDGIVGQTEGSLTGVDFSDVEGMFRSGNTIYYAAASNGELHTVPFAHDVPSAGGSTVWAPGIDWRAHNLFLAGTASFSDQPTASPTVSCVRLSCTFRGAASAGSAITGWRWDFGDGSSAATQNAKHTYPNPGKRSVRLSVADSAGAVTTRTVTVDPGFPVRFIGARNATRFRSLAQIAAPRGVRAGDTELLFISVASGSVAGSPRGLTDWHLVARVSNGSLLTRVYRRTAGARDSRRTVTVPLNRRAKSVLQFADYRNVGTAVRRGATGHDRNTRRHVAPAVRMRQPNGWVITYWADLSTHTRRWELAAHVVPRTRGFGAGNNHVSAVTVDSGRAVPQGKYRPRIARTNAISARGNSVAIVLPRAG